MLAQLSRTIDKIKHMQKAVILLVDDDQLITESLCFILKKKYQFYVAESRIEAKEILSKLDVAPQLALIDLGLPPLPHQADEGFALIENLLAHEPKMKILILSNQNEESNIQHALTMGAVDYIPKPVNPTLLQSRLQHHLMLQLVEEQKSDMLRESAIIGNSSSMKGLRKQVEQYSASIYPVLIEGETGTGKELVAKAIHEGSTRSKCPYKVVNCAAISEAVIEPHLFGYVKKVDGKTYVHKGLLFEANDGTLFVDEIGVISDSLQLKLLRLMEQGEYYRLGETVSRKTQARIIVATNKNLAREVKKGRFNASLYHRLNILNITIPPLREHKIDSMLLRMHFQNLFENSIKHFSLNDEANKLWGEYDYPGNIRELKNLVIRLGTKYPGKIVTKENLENELEIDAEIEEADSLKTGFKAGRFNDMWLMKEIASGDFNLEDAMSELENHCIDIAMKMYDGNFSKVSSSLNMSRSELYTHLQKKIEKGED